MGNKLKILFIILGILTLIALFTLRLEGQILEILPARALVIEVTNPPSLAESIPTWTFTEKIEEARQLVASASLELKVSKKDHVYYENRITRDSRGRIRVAQKRLTDPEREIALVIMDLITGDLDLIKITEKGNNLTVPPGYEIENVTRPNGITNNAWNTCRRVITPENKAIILNVWPHYVNERVPRVSKNKRGKTITTHQTIERIDNRVYGPYCEEVHVAEFVQSGVDRRKSIPRQAMDILRERGVMSRAFPDKLIADVEHLRLEYFEGLSLIEHMDYGEFLLDPRKSAERVDVILGMNGENGYRFTCSRAGACGWVQYTKRTWNAIDSKYPAVQLPAFETGAPDHLYSMIAAILLFDNNLDSAIKKFGLSILNNSDLLGEMLFANFNGGTVRPYGALKASILKSLEDWLTNPMRTETQQYIEKWRYVRSDYQ